jgi:hypothetical protein
MLAPPVRDLHVPDTLVVVLEVVQNNRVRRLIFTGGLLLRAPSASLFI